MLSVLQVEHSHQSATMPNSWPPESKLCQLHSGNRCNRCNRLQCHVDQRSRSPSYFCVKNSDGFLFWTYSWIKHASIFNQKYTVSVLVLYPSTCEYARQCKWTRTLEYIFWPWREFEPPSITTPRPQPRRLHASIHWTFVHPFKSPRNRLTIKMPF